MNYVSEGVALHGGGKGQSLNRFDKSIYTGPVLAFLIINNVLR